jgi:hypothetical protein
VAPKEPALLVPNQRAGITEGKLPATRPRYGLARWIWFRPLTRLASLLALRDGHTTTDRAWQAALTAVDLYGSARNARKAIRAGRPVPRPEPRDTDEHDMRDDADVHQRDASPHNEELRDVQACHADPQTTLRYAEPNSLARDIERDTHPRHDDRDITEQYRERDTATPLEQRDTTTAIPVAARETTSEHRHDDPAESVDPAAGNEPTARWVGPLDRPDDQDDATVDRSKDQGGHDEATAEDQEPPVIDGPADHEDNDAAAPTGNSDHTAEPQGTRKGALIARMKTHARELAAHGVSVTGADLDRQFGTRDYGRKILRQLAAETQPSEPEQP